MRFVVHLSLVIYFMTGFVEVVIGQDCSNKTVQVCLQLLTNYGFDIAHIDDDLPTWNESESRLSQRCGAYKDFSTCMQSVITYCTNRQKYDGWNAAYDFLCKKSNLTDVAGYLQCYAKDEVVSKVNTTCQQTFNYKLKLLQNGTNSISDDKWPDYCKVADGFFTCINETVTTSCKDKAAAWQWTWDRELSWPSLKKCPGWTDPNQDDSSTSAWTVALIVVLVLITVFMIFVIVFFLIFLFKKPKPTSRNQHGRRRAAAAAPPPPYSAVVYTSSENGAEPEAHLVDISAVRPDGSNAHANAVPASDVVLPPLYMELQPPAPAYEPHSPYTELDPKAPAYESHSEDGVKEVENEVDVVTQALDSSNETAEENERRKHEPVEQTRTTINETSTSQDQEEA